MPPFSSFDDEADLIEALRADDARAYEYAVRTYGPRMLAATRRILNDEAAAEDSVQDAFLSAFRKLDTFNADARFGTWLHRIAVNAALMRRRSVNRKAEQSLDELMPRFDDHGIRIEPVWSHDQTVETIFERDENRRLILEKIAELPDSYRIVLTLRDIEELDTAEVARMLDMTEGAIKTRLHRARAALKKLLEPLWEELSK